METKLKHTLLAICSTSLLLSACGGGGGGGMVRNDPPGAVVPSPPTPASAENVCPAPITSDCVADDRWKTASGSTIGTLYLYDGRQSSHALIKRGTNYLGLSRGEFRFDAGTTIEGGGVQLDSSAVLRSNVTVLRDAWLSVFGEVRGDVTTRAAPAGGVAGFVYLGGTVAGNVTNEGAVQLGMIDDLPHDNRILGNYRQTATGTLAIALPSEWEDHVAPLQVSGRADLDGTLHLFQAQGWGFIYPLPVSPVIAHVLHADGGVFGQFAQWTSPGLFIEGSVRYGGNDVWFDLIRASVQAAMAANAVVDSQTLASAAHLDAALSRADGFALAPAASLDDAQRRFLASAASILRAREVAQATRTLDSLSGQAHALAQDVVHEQAAATVAQLDARLDRLPRDSLQAGLWSMPLAQHGRLGGSYSVDGQASGFDQWLGPQWLIGGSVARAQSQMQFERMGGHGRGDSPMASVYAHYRSGDWHATGVVGAGRSTLQLDRPIDLGAAGTHLAHSRREIGQLFLHGELGRHVALDNGRRGNGVLTPFAALDYSALRSDGFSEQGDTGFELVAQPGRTTQWSAAVGARYAQDWRMGARGWLRLNLDARYQQRLAEGGDAQQAAFVGTPDALFALTAWSRAEHGVAMSLGLAGGFDDRWRWSLDYAQRFGGEARQGGWFAGLRREF